jgi:polynucleotide 5'-hydroxyl-kinase GRC3/NOL9
VNDREIRVPPAWREIAWEELRGVVLVVGAPDTGKSTLARYAVGRMGAAGIGAGWLDGDPGQSALGPPATMTLAPAAALEDDPPGENPFPSGDAVHRFFVGALSPAGHMLRMVVGARRLADVSAETGLDAVVHDTSGMVDPDRGGLYLKHALVDLLRPGAIVALQRDGEMESFLEPLRRRAMTVLSLPRPDGARSRKRDQRRRHRVRRFRRYFAGAGSMEVRWPELAVLPRPRFDRHRLVALEDADGLALGLGIIEEHDREQDRLLVRTPLESADGAETLRVGDVRVDPESFRHRPVEKP